VRERERSHGKCRIIVQGLRILCRLRALYTRWSLSYRVAGSLYEAQALLSGVVHLC